MIKIILLFAAIGAWAQTKECASVEECRVQLAVAKHQLVKVLEQNRMCANELFNAKLSTSLALPEDLQKKLESFTQPVAAAPPVAAKEKK